MPLKLVKREGSEIWHIRGSIDGRRIQETTSTTDKKSAEQFRVKREAALWEEIKLGGRGNVSFVSAAEAFLEFQPRSAGTESRVDRLTDHFGAKMLSEITQARIDDACVAILRPGAKPSTRVREIYTPIISVLNFAAKRKWCDKPDFDKPQSSSGKTRWITPDEALRLERCAAKHLGPLLRFILCTGARMSEALDLSWADVDLVGKRATFRETKSGKDRIVALPPKAIEALDGIEYTDREKKFREGAVFRTPAGEPYADRNRLAGGQIKTAWKTACEAAKITNLTPHDLRHTWATWFYSLTKDLLLLRHEGAWASTKMVERYAHLMPSGLEKQVYLVWGNTHPRIGKLPRAR